MEFSINLHVSYIPPSITFENQGSSFSYSHLFNRTLEKIKIQWLTLTLRSVKVGTH